MAKYKVKKPWWKVTYRFSLVKLSLSLLIIIGSGLLIRIGYLLFSHQVRSPIKEVIIFLAGVGIVIWVASILHSSKYRWKRPSFKLILSSVLIIALTLTFAGVEPMSSTKDKIITSIRQTWGTILASNAKEEQVEESSIVVTPQQENEPNEYTIFDLERATFEVINMVREDEGLPPTNWDDELYALSKAHTQEMAWRGELFHTPINAAYGENCWGGDGYYRYSGADLIGEIVASWMSSPLHRAWLLYEPIRTSVVSIVITPEGQYASWTFWTVEVGEGPEIIRNLSNEWQGETGGNVPWIDWLESKGYLY